MFKDDGEEWSLVTELFVHFRRSRVVAVGPILYLLFYARKYSPATDYETISILKTSSAYNCFARRSICNVNG